ncbi:unnamed protein product [Umbelopsis vinacea]|jgi:hypothetical protein
MQEGKTGPKLTPLYWILSFMMLAILGLVIVQAIMLALIVSTAKDIFNADGNGNFYLRTRLDGNYGLGTNSQPINVNSVIQSSSYKPIYVEQTGNAPGNGVYNPLYMKAVV